MRKLVAVLVILLLVGIAGLAEGPPLMEDGQTTLTAMEQPSASIVVDSAVVIDSLAAFALYVWSDSTGVLTIQGGREVDLDNYTAWRDSISGGDRHPNTSLIARGLQLRT